jgi:hypothetical protein
MTTNECLIPEIAQKRERLVAEHVDRGFAEDDVRAHLDDVCRRLSGARVRSYLPVLVERALRAELRAGLQAA